MRFLYIYLNKENEVIYKEKSTYPNYRRLPPHGWKLLSIQVLVNGEYRNWETLRKQSHESYIRKQKEKSKKTTRRELIRKFIKTFR